MLSAQRPWPYSDSRLTHILFVVRLTLMQSALTLPKRARDGSPRGVLLARLCLRVIPCACARSCRLIAELGCASGRFLHMPVSVDRKWGVTTP